LYKLGSDKCGLFAKVAKASEDVLNGHMREFVDGNWGNRGTGGQGITMLGKGDGVNVCNVLHMTARNVLMNAIDLNSADAREEGGMRDTGDKSVLWIATRRITYLGSAAYALRVHASLSGLQYATEKPVFASAKWV
jgi:hypothetical protein